jgi:hypothetical protein
VKKAKRDYSPDGMTHIYSSSDNPDNSLKVRLTVEVGNEETRPQLILEESEKLLGNISIVKNSDFQEFIEILDQAALFVLSKNKKIASTTFQVIEKRSEIEMTFFKNDKRLVYPKEIWRAVYNDLNGVPLTDFALAREFWLAQATRTSLVAPSTPLNEILFGPRL